MNRSGFFKEHKDLISDFVAENGTILNKPLGKVVRKELDKDRVDFLRHYIDLLLNSPMLTAETRLYMTNRYITYDGVSESLSVPGKPKVNPSTTKAKIWQDKNKIIMAFGDRLVVDMLEYDVIDMDSYRDKLRAAQERYGMSKLLRNICLTLPETPQEVKSLSDKDFQEFWETVSPFTRVNMRDKVNQINLDALSYARHILSSGLLTAADIERKNRLIDLLTDK